jgi:glycogen operon protein
LFNAYWEALDFELPVLRGSGSGRWHRWIDTSLATPNDIVEWQSAPELPGLSYRAEPRSIVILIAGFEFEGNPV